MRGRGAPLVLSFAPLLLGGLRPGDAAGSGAPRTPRPADGEVAVTACEGNRAPLPQSLLYELDAAAFPGSGRPDVAVHVPPGFDATRRPGLVVYFHGWKGCVEAALSDVDVPCSADGEARASSHLAAQLDGAHVNAVLVAVELRADMPTGESGQLATPGGLRALLRELLDGPLGAALGGSTDPCPLEVDALDRVMVVAHSGGYQAAASVLARGDVPRITEVVLLDALYGADDVFASWIRSAVDDLDAPRRFVDLYTCCGGTVERSRALSSVAFTAARGLPLVFDDDRQVEGAGTDGAPMGARLERPLVFERVEAAHDELPAAYMGAIFQGAGFARL